MIDQVFMDVNESEDITHIRINGDITEDNELPLLRRFKPNIIINTANVRRINSVGVQDWIDWINNLKGRIYLVECSPAFMAYVNMLEKFIGTATLHSFYVPFFCTPFSGMFLQPKLEVPRE